MSDEKDYAKISLELIVFLSKYELAYNQAKAVLSECEFLLGSRCVLSYKSSEVSDPNNSRMETSL